MSCSSHLSVDKSYYSPVLSNVKSVCEKVQRSGLKKLGKCNRVFMKEGTEPKEYRKYDPLRHQAPDRYKHLRLTDDPDDRHRSEYPGVLPEDV